MLVLSRKAGESIKIADDVTVTVVKVFGDRVKLSISAPAHIAVHRQEVWALIQAEKAAAVA